MIPSGEIYKDVKTALYVIGRDSNIIQLESLPWHFLRIYEEDIQKDLMDRNSYLTALNDIYRNAKNTAVAGYLSFWEAAHHLLQIVRDIGYLMNAVLGGCPPSIADCESNLPKKTGVVLA